MVLEHLPLREITLLISKPSIQIEAEAEVVAAQVVVATETKIKVGKTTRVKIMEEDTKL